jgi:hypothetical protein
MQPGQPPVMPGQPGWQPNQPVVIQPGQPGFQPVTGGQPPQVNPYQQQVNPYQQQVSPLQQQVNPYQRQPNPYQRQVNPYQPPQVNPYQPPPQQPPQSQLSGRPLNQPVPDQVKNQIFGLNQAPGNPAAGRQGMTIGGGIAGVASKSEDEGIKVYNERTKYNEWEFIYDPRKDNTSALSAIGRVPTQNLGSSSQPTKPEEKKTEPIFTSPGRKDR